MDAQHVCLGILPQVQESPDEQVPNVLYNTVQDGMMVKRKKTEEYYLWQAKKAIVLLSR